MSERPDRHGLTRLSDRADLARVVPGLAPEDLHQLIRHRGLDACGPLVAAATPQQLAAVFDLDLWQPSPGRNDQFDVHRFGVWVETLMEEGEAVAVRILEAMDRDLAIAGLSRHVRVFDRAALETIAPSGKSEQEIAGFVVRARIEDAWDAVAGLLAALADDRPDVFRALMEGCRRLSDSTPEADGFYDLMLAPEQSMYDLSVDREDRQSRLGYVAAADARAYLQLARRGGGAKPQMDHELAFLANVLIAGASVPSGPLTPQQAWDAASGVCRLGLAARVIPPTKGVIDAEEIVAVDVTSPDGFRPEEDLIAAFETGWRLLYEEVSMFTARRLLAVVSELRSVDAEVQRDLKTLRRELRRYVDAGTPWRVDEALEVIGMLDMPTWACLRGLLSECPVFPDALPAVLERRAGPISATRFECFSNGEQIRQAHAFAERILDGLL